MKTKKPLVPTHLPLADIVLDPALQVRPVSEAVAEEYAEHLESLPPSIVWDVESQYRLGDGWHRYRAHELAGKTEMRVTILTGTLEQAKLYVASCDARVGLRRNRAAKQAAVTLVLETVAAVGWSDRKIAAHCGVSHTFVALHRARLAAGPTEEPAPRHGNVTTSGVAEVGAADGNVAVSPPVASQRPAEHPWGRKGGNVATSAQSDDGSAIGLTAVPGDEAHVKTGRSFDDIGEGMQAFDEPSSPTVNDVINRAEALLVACESDEQRREALEQLLEALSGMLSGLDANEETQNADLIDLAL